MKKFWLAMICTFSLGLAHADNVEFQVNGSLSREQQAQLQLQAAQFAAANTHPADQHKEVVETAKEWADLGTAIGSGLASTAKELGVAANDFANTPVGRMTMLLIVWHFLGAQIVHVTFGLLTILVLMPIWVYVYKRTWFTKTIIVYEPGKGPNGQTKEIRKDTVDQKRVGDGTQFALWFSFVVIIATSVIAVFSF